MGRGVLKQGEHGRAGNMAETWGGAGQGMGELVTHDRAGNMGHELDVGEGWDRVT